MGLGSGRLAHLAEDVRRLGHDRRQRVGKRVRRRRRDHGTRTHALLALRRVEGGDEARTWLGLGLGLGFGFGFGLGVGVGVGLPRMPSKCAATKAMPLSTR